MPLLQIGDIIAQHYYSSVSILGEIDRVTEKNAWAGDTRFQRDQSARFYKVGNKGFHSMSYSVVTPEKAKEINAVNRHKNNLSKIKDANLSKLTHEQAAQILQIINQANGIV